MVLDRTNDDEVMMMLTMLVVLTVGLPVAALVVGVACEFLG